MLRAVSRRCLAARPPLLPARLLATALERFPNPTARNQLLLPYLLMADRGAYDVIVGWVQERRRSAKRITTAELVDQLDVVFEKHGKKPWSTSLKVRWAQGILSVLRDVAAVGRGANREEFLPLVVRPEDARMDDATNELAGEVIDCSFIGRCFRLTLNVAGAMLRLDWPRREEVGASVRFSLPVERCRAVPVEPG